MKAIITLKLHRKRPRYKGDDTKGLLSVMEW